MLSRLATFALGPASETRYARALRWMRDRQDLAELEAHRLRDLGLTPAEVQAGVPFDRSSPQTALAAAGSRSHAEPRALTTEGAMSQPRPFQRCALSGKI